METLNAAVNESYTGAPGNYYNDSSLIVAARDGTQDGYDEGFLDFYQVHCYKPPGEPNWNASLINVLNHRYDSPAYAGGFDKPVLVGEVSTTGSVEGNWTSSQLYRAVYHNGWAGVLGWQLAGGERSDTVRDLMQGMQALQFAPGLEPPDLAHSNTVDMPLRSSDDLVEMHARLEELTSDAMEFWKLHIVDTVKGGCFGTLDRHGAPTVPRDKGLIQTAQHLLAFSIWYELRDSSAAIRSIADHMYAHITDKFGIVHPDTNLTEFAYRVTEDGVVADNRTVLLAQAWVIDAFSVYGRVFNNSAAKQRALELFRSIDARAHDVQRGGYNERNDVGWLTDGATRSTGTMRSLMDSFVSLHKATADHIVVSRLQEVALLLARNLTAMLPTANFSLALVSSQYDDHWRPVPAAFSRLSVGENLATALSLFQVCEYLDSNWSAEHEASVRASAIALTATAARYGHDFAHGGFFEFVLLNITQSSEANRLDVTTSTTTESRTKIWWIQAQALSALWHARKECGDAHYVTLLQSTLHWIEYYQRDLRYKQTEWFWSVGEDAVKGIRSATGPMEKGSEWKTSLQTSRSLVITSNDISSWLDMLLL